MRRRRPVADDGAAGDGAAGDGAALGVDADGGAGLGVDADGDAPRRGKPAFTGRAAVLAVVIAALALAIAAPLRELLSQRSQISSLNTNIASQQQQVDALQKAQKQWADPKFVEQQARDRLHYVFPGQVPYVTLSPTPAASASASAAAAQALASQPWYGRLWSSVEGAAHVSPKPSSSPSPTLAPALISPPAASAPVVTASVAPGP